MTVAGALVGLAARRRRRAVAARPPAAPSTGPPTGARRPSSRWARSGWSWASWPRRWPAWPWPSSRSSGRTCCCRSCCWWRTCSRRIAARSTWTSCAWWASARARAPSGVPTRLVDTSAIIDGRLIDVLRTRFLSGAIVVPDFVLEELQRVADSADGLKRARGRRGLEIVEELKAAANGGFSVRAGGLPRAGGGRRQAGAHGAGGGRLDRHHRLQPQQGRPDPGRSRC